MFSFLLSLLGVIKDPLTDWLKRRQETINEKHKLELEIIRFKQQQAASESEYRHAWELESLKASSGLLRNVSFFSWYAPIVVALFFPNYAKIAMENLSMLPSWYTQGFMVITFAVWGISVSKDTVTNIVMSAIGAVGRRKEEKRRVNDEELDLPEPFKED